MRQTGYYFVDEIGRIAYYNGVHWTMCGTQDRYLGHTFDAVSTPITPEKMAAIDKLLETFLDGILSVNQQNNDFRFILSELLHKQP